MQGTTELGSCVVREPRAARTIGGLRRRGDVLMGCLIAVGVVVVLGIIAAVVVAMNFKTWMTDLAAYGIKQAATAIEMPAAELPQVQAIVDTVATEVKADRIKADAIEGITEIFFGGTWLGVAQLQALIEKHVATVGLPAEEVTGATATLNRVATGVADEKITLAQLATLMKPLMQPPDGTTTSVDTGTQEVELLVFKPTLTVDEVRAVVSAAETLATEAGITEARPLDVSDLLTAELEKLTGVDLPEPAAASSGG